uniref:Receptor-type tyrosine-protein phosphatase C n=1 Tax=Ascaris suum TaxID=6253 RepID=F1L6S6_ASCSU
MKSRPGRRTGAREEVTRRTRKHRKKFNSKTLKTASEEAVTAQTEESTRESHRKKPSAEPRKKRSADIQRLRHIAQRRRTYIREDVSKETEEADSNSVDRTVDKTTTTQGPADSSNQSATGDRAQRWVFNCCQRGLRPLLKEFSSIRKFLPKSINTVYFAKNSNKNRYMDVLCLDDTRVVLQGRPKDNDYIHANWVQLPSHRKYICTQGPLDETVEDFWLMVFKEKVAVIIMLCDLCESGETKCAEYYPNAIGKALTFGDIKVKNLQKQKSVDTMICFTLAVEISNETHKLIHYKWAGWPDRVAPASPCPIVELVLKTKPLCSSGPFVVHCSAGIGRTGTYCALEYAIDKLALGGTLSIVEVIKEIRKQRLHSVQTTLQYLYLHTCLIEYLATTKVVQRDSHIRKFQRDYEKYLKKFNEKNAKNNANN